MIIISLIGGLGNQMFQYAAGRSLAIYHNNELKLDISAYNKSKKTMTPRNYCLSHYNIYENFVSKDELYLSKKPHSYGKNFLLTLSGLINRKSPRNYKIEPFFNYYSDFFLLPDDIYLIGFWQSEKYFKNIEAVIRREFTLKYPPDPLHIQMSQKILQTNAISIHVRRGDYITNSHANKYHGICSSEYYTRAIDYIYEKCSDPHFFIFSDDPQWIRQNMDIQYPHTFMGKSENSKDYEDMWLMSLCKHHIIANSSFSWWSAWLCNNVSKIVIAPKRWVTDPNIDTRDVLPKEWVLI